MLLKVVLELVLLAKDRIKTGYRQASTRVAKLGAGLLLWFVLFASKFVVLEIIDFVFGDRVSLGGFFSVTALILALMLARAGVRRLLHLPISRAAA